MPDTAAPPQVAPDGVSLAGAIEQGGAARRAGRRDDAVGWFRRALAIAPAHRGARLELAGTLRELRRLDEAEPLYRAQLADAPGTWQALLGLGLCARMRRDLPASAAHLAAALALAPHDRPLRLEYATTLRELRRLEEAESLYRALLAEAPGFWQALLGLALCARMRRDLPAAAAHFAAALALAPKDRTLRLEYAGTLLMQRQADAAEALFRGLLAEAPRLWQALQGLGLCARIRNDRAAAQAHFAAATEAAPEIDGPWFELAGELRAAGQYAAARAVLLPLCERPSAAAQAWLGLGQIERAAGDHAAALAIFRQGYARDPGQAQLLLEIAAEERALGRLAAAEQWLRQAAAIEAVAGAALLKLGELARLRQHTQEALDLFQQVAALPGAPTGVYPQMAQTLADLGRLAEALELLDAAERQTGGGPELLRQRVLLLRRAGLRDEALAAARAGVAAHPTHFDLWREWFECERFFGDVAGLDRCLAAAPAGTLRERAQALLARGHLAAQRWQFDAATERFAEALALDPRLPGAHEVLARVSLLRFDIPAARAHLQEMKRQRAPNRYELGLSPHLAHTHIGNLFDEFAIDAAALAALADLQATAPAERIAWLLALLRDNPEHTPTAIALLLALRQAGRFAPPWGSDGAPAIPASIAQYWNEPAPPDDVAALMQSWRACNPAYRYRAFDHDQARDFLRTRCPPEVLRAYSRAREPAMKADIFRLAWLFAEGGCYVDADDRCLRPLDELLVPGVSFVAFQEEYGTLGNNFLAAAPQHPLFGLALQLAVQAVNRGDDDMLWLATGPGLITRAFARTLVLSGLLPAVWLQRSRILDRHELERVVATHCAVGYKQSRKHWLRATFGQPKPPPGRLPA